MHVRRTNISSRATSVFEFAFPAVWIALFRVPVVSMLLDAHSSRPPRNLVGASVLYHTSLAELHVASPTPSYDALPNAARNGFAGRAATSRSGAPIERREHRG